MYLKHLTINGFKSFAKKGELEFSSPITGIVGPNGSGKSNVAESFRFVLGEQATSKMRGKKGEDLIWGGSDQVSRSNRASVNIVLDNQKRIFPLDFDEINLERVVHRDGQNEYLINGSTVRLKDVQEVLAAANIGPSGHHIISQGEADRILSASNKERREMIEDALGLKAYQYKKTEAEKKLQKTKDNIEKVESLRREVAPHLKFLEKQVKKLERAVEIRAQLRDAYSEYLKREDIYLAGWQDRISVLLNPLQSKIKEIEAALSEVRSILESKKHDAKRDELMSVEKTLSSTREAHQSLLREVGALEGQIHFLERRIADSKRKQGDVSNINISYTDIDKLVTSLEVDAERAVKSEDVSHLRRSLNDLVHSLRQFLSRAIERPSKESGEEEELESLQKQKESLDAKLATAKAKENDAERAYQEIRASIESDQSESREAERVVFRLVNERREAEMELSRLEFEKSGIERDRDDFKSELQEAVALLGRDATLYLDYKVDATKADIEKEDRTVQRNRRHELEKLKIRLEELGGANVELEQEYKTVKERDDFLAREIDDLNTSVAKLEELIVELEAQLDVRFSEGITKISAEFNRFFSLMFGGGEATLSQVKIETRSRKSEQDEEEIDDVTEEVTTEKIETGISIDVKLPNKRVKGLDMLSGGERALTSIALIFAMSQVNPPLFVILDETDAALDEANSRRYGDMIEALAKKSQLILITHNRETMSRAGILYGVTMTGDGVSKLLSVKLDDALAVAK